MISAKHELDYINGDYNLHTEEYGTKERDTETYKAQQSQAILRQYQL